MSNITFNGEPACNEYPECYYCDNKDCQVRDIDNELICNECYYKHKYEKLKKDYEDVVGDLTRLKKNYEYLEIYVKS